MAVGLAVGMALAGLGVAAAQEVTSPDAPAATSEGDRADRRPETPLTGEAAEKARQAALTAVPGATVDRVETDSDGAAYEAHVTGPDGSRSTVKPGEDFQVTGVEEDQGRGGPGGHFGPGQHGPRGGRAPLAAETAEKVEAAALAAVPGGTVDRAQSDPDGYHAHVTKPDGTRVVVRMGEGFQVTSVDDESAPRS